jgi:hypothetical protein
VAYCAGMGYIWYAYSQVLGLIWVIDGTFIEICKPWSNDVHKFWSNGHEKIYCMNKKMVVGHHGSIIFLGRGYFDSFLDANIIHEFNLYKNCSQFLVRIYDYFDFFY